MRRAVVGAALALAGTMIGVIGWWSDRLDAVQTRWEDALQPGAELGDEPGVTVVAFDRASISSLGGWPVERDVHADLIRIIGRSDPAVIAYDVLFNTPGEGDTKLAAAIASTPTVLANALTLRNSDGQPPTVEDRADPTPVLAEAAAEVAHANVSLSGDTGVVRSVPLYGLTDRGLVVPSIALSSVAVADAAPTAVIERPGGVQVGGRFVPASDGVMPINWSDLLGPAEEIPASALLDGEVDPAQLSGRIVVVGVTEPTLGDQHITPLDRSGATSGVHVLANAINTISTNSYLREGSRAAHILLIAAIAATVALAFATLRLNVALAVAIGIVAVTIVFGAWRFHTNGEHWNVVWPTLTALVVGTSMSAWRYVDEIRHRRRAWALFAAYVPATVVDELSSHQRLEEATRTTRSEISVLFCDLRGFTPIAARLGPDDVRQLLDRYYAYAVAIIHSYGGTVMQFVGDEVFAVFGAPIAREDDAGAALRCALELQRRIGMLDDELSRHDLPAVRFGIGVHRGDGTMAHVGTDERRQYSAVGDVVNVGSRLCGQAAAGEVVASRAAASRADPGLTAEFGAGESVALKGIRHSVEVIRTSPSPATDSQAGPHERGRRPLRAPP